MDRYRYKVITTQTDMGETKLNEFGRRGFELVGVLVDQYGYKYYFKVKMENNG